MRALSSLALLALASGQEFGSGTRFITNETLVSSTCTGAFNTPCAIGVVNRLVVTLRKNLEAAANAAAEATILAAVSSGAAPYAEPINFWTTVYSASGTCLASGRPAVAGQPTGCRAAGGIAAEAMAAVEAGFPQPGLWGRIVDAAVSGDGYYSFLGYDNYNKRAHTSDAATRVGFVKRVTTPSGTVLYVTSAYSDVPLSDSWTGGACSPTYGTLCSISYARRTLGKTVTAMLRAETPAHLHEVLARVQWREFNEQGASNGVGFYPFVFAFDPATINTPAAGGGRNAAHGSNPLNANKTLSEMLITGADGDASVGTALGGDFANAALDGGGYVAYKWKGGQKVSYVVGLRRFGQHYYVGVGFNHVETTRATGPGCEVCKMAYNYPCSWENVIGLVGHAQTLLLMGKGTTSVDLTTAFNKITNDAAYGADQSLVQQKKSTAGALYAFVFAYSTRECVAHGVKVANVGSTEVISQARHEAFMAKADSGGGFVSCTPQPPSTPLRPQPTSPSLPPLPPTRLPRRSSRAPPSAGTFTPQTSGKTPRASRST
jgi:hypothetical protein